MLWFTTSDALTNWSNELVQKTRPMTNAERSALFRDGKAIDRAIKRAVREALAAKAPRAKPPRKKRAAKPRRP